MSAVMRYKTANCLPNYLEATVRADRLKATRTGAEFDNLLFDLAVEVVPTTPGQARLAREAYLRFGKAATLNLGDCFAYALSQAHGEPLLFKGDGFRLTDVEAAL